MDQKDWNMALTGMGNALVEIQENQSAQGLEKSPLKNRKGTLLL